MPVPSPRVNSNIATSKCWDESVTNNSILITVTCKILNRETKRNNSLNMRIWGFVLKYFRASVSKEVLPSFRSFGSITELPFVRKYYPASVRSNIFPSFRSFGSISELPFVRKYCRAFVRADVSPSVRPLGSTDKRRNNVTARKRKVLKGG